MYLGCLGLVILKYLEVIYNIKRDGVRRIFVKFVILKIEVLCYIKFVFCYGFFFVDIK